VAVGEGLIFAGLTNGHVVALREKTGEPVWNTFVGIEPARAGQGVAGAPVYATGRVIVGTAGDFGFRGKVVALDAQTGKKAWVMAAVDSRTGKVAWKEFRGGRPAGALTTAGGLLFQMMPDGNFVARDAKTGTDVWQFQTGQAGGGPAASYEIAGEQYIALGLRDNVLAFKLDGAVKPFPAREQIVLTGTPSRFNGPIQDVSRIEIVSNVRDNSGGGSRYYNDEYAFSAYRARVKAGTQVVWVNNGRLAHTIVAEDGSWTTGRLSPLEAGAAVFDTPGSHGYMCKEHPWARAEVIVVP
jgi:hypothetical protein